MNLLEGGSLVFVSWSLSGSELFLFYGSPLVKLLPELSSYPKESGQFLLEVFIGGECKESFRMQGVNLGS